MKAASKKTNATAATPAAGLGLCPPWTELKRKLEALFRQDPDVTVAADLDGDAKRIRILVQSADKADALSRLLPPRREFGNVEVAVEVSPANAEPTPAEMLAAAFAGNSAFAGADETPGSEGARARSGSSPQIRRSSGAIMSRPMWARELKRPLRGRQKAA